MGTKHFYIEFIEVSDLEDQINELDLADADKEELLDGFYKTLHLEVIDLILTELPPHYHSEFLHFLDKKPDDPGVRVFIKRAVGNIEERIKLLAQHLKQDFIAALNDYEDASAEWLEGL